MKIGICDDQIEIAKMLYQYVYDFQIKYNYQWEIVIYTSGKEILKDVKEFDLVFMDIEMPEQDGIETGKMIRKMNPFCKIIMATGMENRFKEAFHIQAFRFITKPFEMREVEEALNSFVDANIGNKLLEMSFNREVYVVKEREIRYIQAYNGYSEIIVDNVTMRKEISLNDIEEILDGRIFVRIHRQYIVNLCWVDKYVDGYVYIGNRKIQISRRKKKEFEKKYVEYDISYR